jgi:hypothetical protein
MLDNKPDVIVFSSHKTGTQSITGSLNASGHKAAHCHLLENYNITPEAFLEYLRTHLDEHAKKVIIVSVFRLPIERHISSFFQYYGSRILQSLPTYQPKDTVIAKASIDVLNALLVSDLATKRLAGYKESLHQMFDILGIKPDTIVSQSSATSTRHFGLFYDHPLAEIHLLRFSDLFQDFPGQLQARMNTPITQPQSINISSRKWYASKYNEFKQAASLPKELIEETYHYRKELIELFYPDQFATLLSSDYQKYIKAATSPQDF